MQYTSKSLRNLVIYSVYVRNHTPEGTFRAIEGDLRRIKALGTDVIWLMPIHPIGKEGK
ncbi:MAG: alpha-amylase, partial [bacterium]|nr:alpha-amylase [bacterium]